MLSLGHDSQEPEIWANITEHDQVIFQDNDFEVFVDPASSSHYYKELEINALASTWALYVCVRERQRERERERERENEFAYVCVYVRVRGCVSSHYMVATISRLLKITGLFCKRAL